jgi:hypothetical protein
MTGVTEEDPLLVLSTEDPGFLHVGPPVPFFDHFEITTDNLRVANSGPREIYDGTGTILTIQGDRAGSPEVVADPQRRSEGDRELLERIRIAVGIIQKAIEEDPDPAVNTFRIPEVEGSLAEVLRTLSPAFDLQPEPPGPHKGTPAHDKTKHPHP